MPRIEKVENGVRYIPDKGKERIYLNQSGKIGKFSKELKDKVRYTNDGKLKQNMETGEVLTLSKAQASYRAGYLAACKESATIHKRKNPNYERKTFTHHTPTKMMFPPKNLFK